MVSGYPSAFYDDRLEGWRSASVQVMNQAGAVTEKVSVQLRAGPGALGVLRGPQLHRPPADQAQGGGLGAALPGDAAGERLAVLSAVMAVEAE